MTIRRGFIRPTVFRWTLAIAVCVILASFAAEPIRNRRERFLGIADYYARLGDEYQRNAKGDATMERVGAWHLFMSREYERAADRPWMTPPRILMFPPPGWSPPAEFIIATGKFAPSE